MSEQTTAGPTTVDATASAASLVRRGTRRCLLTTGAIVVLVAVIASIVAGSGGNGLSVAGLIAVAALSSRPAVELGVSLCRWRRLARLLQAVRWHAAMVQIQGDGRYTSAVLVDGERHLQGYDALWSGSAQRAGFGRTRRWNLTPERGPGLVAESVDGWSAVTDADGTYVLLVREPRSERTASRLAEIWARSEAKDADVARPAW